MAEDSPTAAVATGNETPDSPTPKKVKKPLVIVGGLILFMTCGVVAIFFLAPELIPDSIDVFGLKPQSEEAKKPPKDMKGYLYTMDPFVVNLANPDLPRYLKVKIELESQESKPNEEFDKRQPQIRDTILLILTGKTSKEISDSEGKTRLKQEILLKVNQSLRGVKIKAIYFTEFVVQ